MIAIALFDDIPPPIRSIQISPPMPLGQEVILIIHYRASPLKEHPAPSCAITKRKANHPRAQVTPAYASGVRGPLV